MISKAKSLQPFLVVVSEICFYVHNSYKFHFIKSDFSWREKEKKYVHVTPYCNDDFSKIIEHEISMAEISYGAY